MCYIVCARKNIAGFRTLIHWFHPMQIRGLQEFSNALSIDVKGGDNQMKEGTSQNEMGIQADL